MAALDGVHREFHGVFEELIDQSRVLSTGRPCFLEGTPQYLAGTG